MNTSVIFIIKRYSKSSKVLRLKIEKKKWKPLLLRCSHFSVHMHVLILTVPTVKVRVTTFYDGNIFLSVVTTDRHNYRKSPFWYKRFYVHTITDKVATCCLSPLLLWIWGLGLLWVRVLLRVRVTLWWTLGRVRGLTSWGWITWNWQK